MNHDLKNYIKIICEQKYMWIHKSYHIKLRKYALRAQNMCEETSYDV